MGFILEECELDDVQRVEKKPAFFDKSKQICKADDKATNMSGRRDSYYRRQSYFAADEYFSVPYFQYQTKNTSNKDASCNTECDTLSTEACSAQIANKPHENKLASYCKEILPQREKKNDKRPRNEHSLLTSPGNEQIIELKTKPSKSPFEYGNTQQKYIQTLRTSGVLSGSHQTVAMYDDV